MEGAAAEAEEGFVASAGLPFIVSVTRTEPKLLTPWDDFMGAGAAAGDDEIGADASFIEPNVTADAETNK